MSQPSWAPGMMVMVTIALCACAGCGAGLDVAGTGPDDDETGGIESETDTRVEIDAEAADGGVEASADTAAAIDTAPSSDTPALDTAPPPVDTAPLPPDTTPPPADTGFVSTPGTIDCAGTPCAASANRYCCGKTGGPTCGPTGVACGTSGPTFLCDEKADCAIFGFGGVCCSDTSGGGIGCLPGCPAPHVQYCMTDAECLVGKCVASSRGPGKAPHGECSRP